MRFKVGDNVRLISNYYIDSGFPEGTIGTLIKVDEFGGVVKKEDGSERDCFGKFMELVEEKPEKSIFAKIDEKRHCIETLMDAFEMHQDTNIEFAIESVMRDYFKVVKE